MTPFIETLNSKEELVEACKKGFEDYQNRKISKNDFCMFFGFTHGEAITKYYAGNYARLLIDGGFNSGSEAYFSGGINAWKNLNDGTYTFPPLRQATSGVSTGTQPLQKILYGAPGTGKSFKIQNEMIPAEIDPYRVTFYADYYYSDFVGGLRPAKGENGRIEYKFEPGPFAKALRDSFSKPAYIIIEEINRGNAAAIFGDIFQLLDRKGGNSEYSITNHELYQYLVEEGVQGLETDKVFLPANLNILGTMNTADQNVFVLDTAFKRRFRMEYVPIDFDSYYDNTGNIKPDCAGYLENTEVFNSRSTKTDTEGNGAQKQVETELNNIMGDELFKKVKTIVAEPDRNWPTFAAYVNAKIDGINEMEQKISEDKKLGPFFVDTDELNDRKAFADKVLYYLKQDVFKYEDNILDRSYEDIYTNFVKNGGDIFMIFDTALFDKR